MMMVTSFAMSLSRRIALRAVGKSNNDLPPSTPRRILHTRSGTKRNFDSRRGESGEPAKIAQI